ncbi:MAG: hypothetical protein SPJ23_04920 [Eubacteriales bacterium]|nr:hypothetical protein [Eubacteriales bacterium]
MSGKRKAAQLGIFLDRARSLAGLTRCLFHSQPVAEAYQRPTKLTLKKMIKAGCADIAVCSKDPDTVIRTETLFGTSDRSAKGRTDCVS